MINKKQGGREGIKKCVMISGEKKKIYVINKKQGGSEGIKKCVMISGESSS